VTRPVASRLLTYPVLGLSGVGLGDLALGLGLSVFGVALAAGLVDPRNPRGDVVGCIAVLLMTAPVVFARRAPLLASAALAFGAVVNSVLVGHLVRCGAALPAVFFVAFAIGLRCNRRKAVVGMALLAVNILCQGYSDPQLATAKAASGEPAALNALAILVIMLPIAIGFLVAGLLLRQRNEVVASLRSRNEELRDQRERNARLMVGVERANVASEFDSYLHERVGQIAAIAKEGQEELSSLPEGAQQAFKDIQEIGRAALVHMRNVVGNLREDAPIRPQPVLSELDRLLGSITKADARLRTEGDPRLLPPGVELSGYRIVEHALLALANDPASRIDVVVEFRPDSLQLTVVGPSARAAEVRAALGAARERAALHGGTLRSEAQGAFRKTVVQLPIVAGHA
jgi:signal transduction histidine kinase